MSGQVATDWDVIERIGAEGKPPRGQVHKRYDDFGDRQRTRRLRLEALRREWAALGEEADINSEETDDDGSVQER